MRNELINLLAQGARALDVIAAGVTLRSELSARHDAIRARAIFVAQADEVRTAISAATDENINDSRIQSYIKFGPHTASTALFTAQLINAA